MESLFADRISDVPRSFIREILKVAVDPSVISFAGGLPNRELFPVKEIQEAANKVMASDGQTALQYSNSEGYIKLREYISRRYLEKFGLTVPVENILITSGSQQGLDLLGKTLLNEKDDVAIEEPGYLGAIQAFSVYKATFHAIPVSENGMDIDKLKSVLNDYSPKLLYTVPNFQNPSGISYPDENRMKIAEIFRDKRTLLIQDDPYGELRFTGKSRKSFFEILPERTILLGSFSKTIAPSFRIGWIVAPEFIMDKLLVAKQASDLHTNFFSQRIIYQYLVDNEPDNHIHKICTCYHKQCEAMIESIIKYFPKDIRYTTPEGGMFMWVALPPEYSALELFNSAIKKKVAFVPGNPFYTHGKDVSTLRLNFSCVDEKTIEIGIKRLGETIESLIR